MKTKGTDTKNDPHKQWEGKYGEVARLKALVQKQDLEIKELRDMLRFKDVDIETDARRYRDLKAILTDLFR